MARHGTTNAWHDKGMARHGTTRHDMARHGRRESQTDKFDTIFTYIMQHLQKKLRQHNDLDMPDDFDTIFARVNTKNDDYS
jgi:hypothetical protein